MDGYNSILSISYDNINISLFFMRGEHFSLFDKLTWFVNTEQYPIYFCVKKDFVQKVLKQILTLEFISSTLKLTPCMQSSLLHNMNWGLLRKFLLNQLLIQSSNKFFSLCIFTWGKNRSWSYELHALFLYWIICSPNKSLFMKCLISCIC